MCYDKRWAGLTEMMALSSVIGHVIYSVYPTCLPLFHGPIVPRMGTPPTSCYIIWTCDSTLDNNRPFQPNHFVPLFVYSEKERTGNVTEIVKRGSLKHLIRLRRLKKKSAHQRVSGLLRIMYSQFPFMERKQMKQTLRRELNQLQKTPLRKNVFVKNLCSRNSLSGEIC